jgi:uncharacterized membrane protein
MKSREKLVEGVVLGAGVMYLLDPDRGARRRSLLRDQVVHAGKKLGDGLSATARDARNRAVGTASELRARLRQDQSDDAILAERVRSAIGRVVSHPSAINVTAYDGRITLSGHVLAGELDELVRRTERVRGVREVRNELEAHRTANGVPDLQGSGRPREERPELLQENWAPATRLLMGVLGGLMALQGTRTKGKAGAGLSALGLGLLARAITNLPAQSLVGAGPSRRAIDIQKTVRVNAPIDQVWALWSNFEQFPRFMSHLREVRRIGESRSHWVAAGPARIPVEWDAIVTEWRPKEAIAWRSVEGSSVETAGRVRFRPTGDGHTEIDVHMSYIPPGGAVGHAIASLFGSDPKRAMDEDLVRLKSLLEEGKTRADKEPVRLDDVISAGATTSGSQGEGSQR